MEQKLIETYSKFKLELQEYSDTYNEKKYKNYSLIKFWYPKDLYFFYISDCSIPRSLISLLELQIDLVVNCTDDSTLFPFEHLKLCDYIQIPISDSSVDDLVLLEFLKKSDTLEKIHDYIVSGKNVLIHCHAGISRSPTIAMCLLMKYFEFSLEMAHETIKEYRKQIYRSTLPY